MLPIAEYVFSIELHSKSEALNAPMERSAVTREGGCDRQQLFADVRILEPCHVSSDDVAVCARCLSLARGVVCG